MLSIVNNFELEKIFLEHNVDNEKLALFYDKIKDNLNVENNSIKLSKCEIGNDVWIGANVFINTTNNIKIGNGAILGTGAIITKDVPPYAIVVGCNKILRYRFTPEQIEILQRVKWWEWDDKTIAENADCIIDTNKFFAKFG